LWPFHSVPSAEDGARPEPAGPTGSGQKAGSLEPAVGWGLYAVLVGAVVLLVAAATKEGKSLQ
jgi:hypothetical protein